MHLSPTQPAATHLVEITEAKPGNGITLPLGQRRVECDCVGCTGVGADGLLQHTKGQRTQDCISCRVEEAEGQSKARGVL